ncbi:MAG TPA: dynamin family protein, partial [Ignavibacteriaceae bacterium]|nr:dynamin family protein [Ignavibacteriaceae bacterium]
MNNPGYKKLQTSSSLLKLKEIVNTFQIESLRREITIAERYSGKEGADPHIDVVVLGQFKSGKSSFINNLIKEDILTVGVIPVTSVITRLRHSIEEKAIVRFLDGSSTSINKKQIDNFISESKNPKNIKRVELVDLFLPGLEQFGNIRIIDTPGIGSFFKHNTDAAMQWLPEIGLALMAISAERPLAEDDLLLLKDIKRYSAEIKIIITKTDLLSTSQLKEVTEYIKSSLEQSESHPDLLPYSTVEGVEENRRRIIEKIFIPLRQNFFQSFENIFHHKINSIAESCLSYLEIGLKSSYKTEKERENLKDSVIDEHLKFRIIKNELDIITQSYKEKNREVVSNAVMPFLKENREK